MVVFLVGSRQWAILGFELAALEGLNSLAAGGCIVLAFDLFDALVGLAVFEFGVALRKHWLIHAAWP